MPQDSGSAEMDIAEPVERVYAAWTEYESYPLFFSCLREVASLNETVLHWRAAFGAVECDFDVAIIEHVPQRVISWSSLGMPLHAGAVAFETLTESSTRLKLMMQWDHQIVDQPRADVLFDDAQAMDALQSFARHVGSA